MSTPGMPVSGPGKFSQRTDRQPMAQLSNADYGEQKAYKQLQQDAPMAKAPEPGAPSMDLSQMFQGAAANVVPLSEPSQMPSTPVTDGASAGPGAGINALGINQDLRQEDLQRIKSYLPVLEYMGNMTGASWAMRNLVRKVKGIV